MKKALLLLVTAGAAATAVGADASRSSSSTKVLQPGCTPWRLLKNDLYTFNSKATILAECTTPNTEPKLVKVLPLRTTETTLYYTKATANISTPTPPSTPRSKSFALVNDLKKK